MIDNYRGGYKKALLDIYNFMNDYENIYRECKSKKQYRTMVSSLCMLLLKKPEKLDMWMKYGKFSKLKMSSNTKEIIDVIVNE